MSDFLDQLKAIAPHTIVWEPKTGMDIYTKPTFGAAQTFTGYRYFKQMRVASGASGQVVDVLTNSIIYILDFANVGYQDRLYVSGDAAPYPLIQSWEHLSEEDGTKFTIVYLGSGL